MLFMWTSRRNLTIQCKNLLSKMRAHGIGDDLASLAGVSRWRIGMMVLNLNWHDVAALSPVSWVGTAAAITFVNGLNEGVECHVSNFCWHHCVCECNAYMFHRDVDEVNRMQGIQSSKPV